jgi:hypothetical protein
MAVYGPSPYNMFLVTDRSIYFHMTLSAYELFAILYFLSKIIMQVPGRSIYENSDQIGKIKT